MMLVLLLHDNLGITNADRNTAYTDKSVYGV